MAHRDAVGDGDRREFARRAARGRDPFLRRLRLARQRNVAGCRLVPGGGDADQRLVDLLVRQPHRIEKRAVRRALRTNRHMPARQARLVEGGAANVVGHLVSPVGAVRAGTLPPPTGVINAAAGAAPGFTTQPAKRGLSLTNLDPGRHPRRHESFVRRDDRRGRHHVCRLRFPRSRARRGRRLPGLRLLPAGQSRRCQSVRAGLPQKSGGPGGFRGGRSPSLSNDPLWRARSRGYAGVTLWEE